MQRKAHGAQRPRKRAERVSVKTYLQVTSEPHTALVGKGASTSQRRDAPKKWIYAGIDHGFQKS
jgi:hypothetical protein